MSGMLGDWGGGRLRNWRYDDEQNGVRREQHTSRGMEKRSGTGAETDTRRTTRVGLY
jgi:2-keto-3-deoxy-galactonokinase